MKINRRQLAALVVASSALAAPAQALTINPVFNDANINANFGPNATNFKNAFNYAASQFTSAFNDPITVNINVDASNISGGYLGSSNTWIWSYTFGELQTAATADAKSASDLTSVGAGGSLAGANPAPNGEWWVTQAETKALGLPVGAPHPEDGTVTINGAYNYSFAAGVTPTLAQFYIIGVMEHEIAEVMGRIGLSGCITCLGNGVQNYTLFDAFSYTGPGARSLGQAANSFSIDGGVTLLKAFNSNPGGDSRDWASGTNDVSNAFSDPGVINVLSAVDLTALDVLGYDPVRAIPEPGEYAMLIAGFGLLGFFSRSRKQAARLLAA